MSSRTRLVPHVPLGELRQRSQTAPTPVEARRWQLLALIADGQTTKDAVARVGVSEGYVARVVWRFNREGPASLRVAVWSGGHDPVRCS